MSCAFFLERKPSVARNDFHLRLRLTQEIEKVLSQIDDLRINLVKDITIAFLSVAGERPDAQADHSYLQSSALPLQKQTDAGARMFPVISCRHVVASLFYDFFAMNNCPVPELRDRGTVVSRWHDANAQHAIKITDGQ